METEKRIFIGDLTERQIGEEFANELFFCKDVQKSISRAGQAYCRIVVSDKSGVTGAFTQAEVAEACLRQPILCDGVVGLDSGKPSLQFTRVMLAPQGTDTSELVNGLRLEDIVGYANELVTMIGEMGTPYASLLGDILTNAIFTQIGSVPLTVLQGFSYNGGVLVHLMQALRMARAAMNSLTGYEHYEFYDVQPICQDTVYTALIFRAIIESYFYTPQPEAKKTKTCILEGDRQGSELIISALRDSEIPEFEKSNIIHILRCLSKDGRSSAATKEAIFTKKISDICYELDKWDKLVNDNKLYQDGHYIVTKEGDGMNAK